MTDGPQPTTVPPTVAKPANVVATAVVTPPPPPPEKPGWPDILARNIVWFALGLIVLGVVGTVGVFVVIDARIVDRLHAESDWIDKRISDRLRTEGDWLDKRADDRIELAFRKRSEFSNELTDRGYVLFTQAMEREFVELIANLPSIEGSTDAKKEVHRIVEEYRSNLDQLELRILPAARRQTRFLLTGFLQISEGRFSDAVSTLGQYPNGKEVIAKHYLIGVAYAFAKDNSSANTAYSQVLEHIPVKSADLRLVAKSKSNLGNAAIRSGDFVRAQVLFKEALDTDPTLHGAYVNLAEAILRLAEKDKVALALQRPKAFECLCRATIAIKPDDIFKSLTKPEIVVAGQEKRTPLSDLFGGEDEIRFQLYTQCKK